jgi:hypothetical protein
LSSGSFQIIETADFAEAVGRLGGHRFVDIALSTIYSGLARNPYGFPKWDSPIPGLSFRYARTKRIGYVPPLVVIFRIAPPETVFLEHVEEDEAF